ncbi:Hypothetical predicted protein [Olea europaea subsp. europaea]|uniref:Uncharacterized protein n=1 Tax=Olea europaea subsp. europaea TaxID=158383 RepID=A0A8S0RJZ1_OLEEU|nr:Hypothetical predicted protein [Olea europaea subsp. europaea]
MGSLRTADPARKQVEYFSGPLPPSHFEEHLPLRLTVAAGTELAGASSSSLVMVQFSLRSNWADDEHGIGREFGERERDFNLPRSNISLHKPVHNHNWSQ